ncbi:MAG: sugar phosphate nucleotidyltransferase [Bacteroidetes bacterium]|nr:sugar phosphate nucleotidyltransferase [Bacteroidota bacterium]MDA0860530.1 sugar phosphate nucleotidyltransferase [Bacteroidota bacterium]MDA1318742.1 sugar phosphate nucleotidyltransferase [Bacteroidota bacterium]
MMTLLLMAAGSGSRYGKLKQFDELGPAGEFLMEFSIFDALKNGFKHIVVITKQENQEFLRQHLSERIETAVKLDVLVQKIEDIPNGIEISKERKKPWGTAHAVWTARHVIKTPFVIINADDYYGQEAFEGAANFIQNQKNNAVFALVGYQLKDTLSEFGSVSRGVCTVKNNSLNSIIERTKISKSNGVITDQDSGITLDSNATVSMNFWICTPKIFDYTGPYFETFLSNTDNHEKNEIYLPFVAQEMMQNGHISVKVIDAKSQWFGVTYYEDKEVAVNTLAQLTDAKKYPSPLWN